MMNDDLQDEYDEHPSLEEQLTLSLDELHRCGTFFIVVNHLVDASAERDECVSYSDRRKRALVPVAAGHEPSLP